MGKLISIVGNLGAGKTTLAKLLCDQGSFVPYWEKPEERPFQARFTKDLGKWALANQLDFFLFRLQQEQIARQKDEVAVMDGGFDQDFHIFTRNLLNKSYLRQDEFELCERFYHLSRSLLPPPDIIVRILVDIPTLLQRRLARGRQIADQSFDRQVLSDLEALLDSWLDHEQGSQIIRFAFERDINVYSCEIDPLVEQINAVLFESPILHSR